MFKIINAYYVYKNNYFEFNGHLIADYCYIICLKIVNNKSTFKKYKILSFYTLLSFKIYNSNT